MYGPGPDPFVLARAAVAGTASMVTISAARAAMRFTLVGVTMERKVFGHLRRSVGIACELCVSAAHTKLAHWSHALLAMTWSDIREGETG